MNALLQAIVHPGAQCPPWQISLQVFCLDQFLLREAMQAERLALATACNPPPAGAAMQDVGWRAATTRGLRLSREPLAVLDDPALDIAQRARGLTQLYALPGVLTPQLARAHVQWILAQDPPQPRDFGVLAPLLDRGAEYLTLPQLGKLRQHAAALMRRGQPPGAAATSSSSSSSSGVPQQVARAYAAVLEPRLAAVQTWRAWSGGAPHGDTDALARFVQAEGEALNQPGCPPSLRQALAPLLGRARSALNADVQADAVASQGAPTIRRQE